MAETLSNVIRFRGTIQEWETRINSGEWDDKVVFGKVRDENDPDRNYVNRVYAGKSQTNIQYELHEGEYWDNTDIDTSDIPN